MCEVCEVVDAWTQEVCDASKQSHGLSLKTGHMKMRRKITCFRDIPLEAFYLHGHTAFKLSRNNSMYYAHTNRFCVVQENVKPEVLKYRPTSLARSVHEDRALYFPVKLQNRLA